MSTNAAISVRLPLERGPATSTSPSGSVASACTWRGSASCSAEIERVGISRNTPPGPRWSRKLMHRTRPTPSMSTNPFGRGAGAQRFVAALGHQRQQQRLDVARDVHRLAVEHLQLAVDAH